MSNKASLLWAFLFAGLVGLTGEVLNTVLGLFITGGPAEIAIVLTLLFMGVVGMILILTGAYQGVEDKAEMGVMGTFVGFVPAAANMFMELRQQGAKTPQALVKTVVPLCILIGVGCVIALVIALAFMLAG